MGDRLERPGQHQFHVVGRLRLLRRFLETTYQQGRLVRHRTQIHMRKFLRQAHADRNGHLLVALPVAHLHLTPRAGFLHRGREFLKFHVRATGGTSQGYGHRWVPVFTDRRDSAETSYNTPSGRKQERRLGRNPPNQMGAASHPIHNSRDRFRSRRLRNDRAGKKLPLPGTPQTAKPENGNRYPLPAITLQSVHPSGESCYSPIAPRASPP